MELDGTVIQSGDEYPMSPRAFRHATEAEIKLALQKADRIVEWVGLGHTFIAYERDLILVRLDMLMGGEVAPNVFYAWKYTNPFGFLRDWEEIKYVASNETWVRKGIQNG